MINTIEELQIENTRLKNENNLLTGWISLISHDTKQIFGNLKWIIEAYDDNIIGKEDLFKMLPQIKKDATKNFNTAQDTSDWLKTQYGNFKPKNENINAFNLFEQLHKEQDSKITAKELNFEFEGDRTLELITDRTLIHFILNKLVDNAVKYSNKQSKIILNVTKTDREFILSITDFGTGINEKNIDSIFSFESSVFAGTMGEIGAGLSLKIVQSFVFLLYGKIVIKSKLDEGTTVSIYLPQIDK